MPPAKKASNASLHLLAPAGDRAMSGSPKKAATSHELGVVNVHVRMPVQRPCACNGDTRHAAGDVSGHFALQGQLTNKTSTLPVLSGKARGGGL